MKENETPDKIETEARIIPIAKEKIATPIDDDSIVHNMMNTLSEIEMKIDQHLESNNK